MAESIDWRDLLLRYMGHVGREEGAVFIPDPYCDLDVFTVEEIEALEQLNREALAAAAQRGSPYSPY